MRRAARPTLQSRRSVTSGASRVTHAGPPPMTRRSRRGAGVVRPLVSRDAVRAPLPPATLPALLVPAPPPMRLPCPSLAHWTPADAAQLHPPCHWRRASQLQHGQLYSHLVAASRSRSLPSSDCSATHATAAASCDHQLARRASIASRPGSALPSAPRLAGRRSSLPVPCTARTRTCVADAAAAPTGAGRLPGLLLQVAGVRLGTWLPAVTAPAFCMPLT